MNLRERFEKLHPVPGGCRYGDWDKYIESHHGGIGLDDEETLALEHYNALWQGFQSGHAAGLEAAAKFLDEWNTAIGDDLAKPIRAMKEPK